MDDKELKLQNAAIALGLGLITWFEYFEIIRGLK
jgi:hypothetical protein